MKTGKKEMDFGVKSAYERMTAAFFDFHPVEDLNETVHHEFMGYGTASHEFFKGRNVLMDMARTQSDQMRNSNIKMNRNLIYERALAGGASYLIVEEFDFHDIDNDHHYCMRLSSILEKTDDKWLVTHMHGSTPDSNIAEDEALPMEGLRQKNRELEEKIKEGIREAELEAALERIRARTMGMQKSTELKDVVKVIFDQLAQLNINAEHAGIVVDYEPERDWHFWVAETQDIPAKITVPYLDLVWDKQFTEAKKEGNPFFTSQLNFDEKNSFYNQLLPHIEGLTEEAKDFYLSCPGLAISTVIEQDIGLYIENFSGTPYSAEENDILKRFGKVFQQAYTRFLDLKKAEAQTREAQISLAVERVRAKALAMFKSEEILDVVYKLKEEIMGLNIPGVSAATIHLKVPDGRYRAWDLTSIDADENELEISLDISYNMDHTHPDFFMREVWERTEDYFVVIQGADRTPHTVQWLQQNGYSREAEEFEEFLESSQLERAYHPTVPLNNGRMCIDLLEPPEPEIESILKKMAGAFDLAYKRFEDLKKAEAQAREAQIEAALERVRSRTMAMQKSEELAHVAAELFAQMNQLVDNLWTCGFVLCEKDRSEDEWWLSMDGDFTRGFFLPNVDDYAHASLYEGWVQGEDFRAVQLDGEALQEHYDWLMDIPVSRAIFEEMDAAGIARPDWQKLHAAYFSKGYLVLITREPCTEEEIFKRFASVFDLTYTRFLDLKKAEAQTREAQIEASLERARAQSMMMQHSDEISSISNAFHEQLILLGIPSEFSYVWLPDESAQSHQFWASWSEVKAGRNTLQSKQVTYPLDKSEPYTAACFEAWANPDVILEEFIPPGDIAGFFKVWQELLSGADKLKAEYFPEGIYYSEAYMRYGCFGVNIRRKLSEEEKSILKRFSKEFERAYTRFLDLQTAEKQALLIRQERDRLEAALNELHATQDQLVQQEKLASLGQLTAGIAHEIKNPLNFVNNFSELSVELVEEAREEVKEKLSADSHQLTAILDDIEANLRKIHEHGSRADSIVKSMLQHSRGGDGKMEPTPLNPLIKEYVNLAFHGMRAGKDPFNVDIDLQLDESIGEVPLVAEDFSRVILNLVNNGFDAMKEKLTADSRQLSAEPDRRYEPRLKVRTIKNNSTITIEIEDNGPGIPDEIKDKILQPFFTTKKGTQGTGLGLSITNDIIKAHGGRLEVSSNPENGTTFIIHLDKN